MKILQTCGSHSWGGLEMETIKISAALSKKGYDVTLLCPANSSLADHAREAGLTVFHLFNNGSSLVGDIYRLKKILYEKQFELIHTQLSHDLWTIVPALKMSGTKTKLLMSKHVASRLQKKDILHRFLYNRIDGIVTISDFIKANVIETCPVSPVKVETIYNGLPDEDFAREYIQKEILRYEFNIQEETILIGLVGRLTLMKGHMEFLKAARLIIDSGIDNVIFMAIGGTSYGEEDFEKEILALAEDLKLGGKFIFTGFRKDIMASMASLDILAFPSHKESFGNTLVEAMACGIPAVASNSGAVPEIVEDERSGYLVPPFSPQQLAEKLILLIKDPDKRKIFGQRGKEIVKEKFLFSNYIAKLEAKYKDLL